MSTRIAIQILSYNRSEYLEQTLSSLKTMMGQNDKICVLEQSDNPEEKTKCIDICKKHKVDLIDLYKNLGQRGATNIVYHTGFFNDCEFVMLSDHDNIFHESLDIYCNKLNLDKTIFVATGYSSLEHDIERKDWEWLIKSTCRAGHMVMRSKDFLKLMPIDLNYTAGVNVSWFAGLDWYLTYWGVYLHPGIRQEREFIACYPGGVQHIGSNSCWQGTYTSDDPTQEEAVWMRNVLLEEIIKKYPPRHAYLTYQYSYEKNEQLDLPANIKEYKYNILGNDIIVYDFKTSQSTEQIYNELKNDEYNISKINFQDNDIVIDLGSNIGMFSIALAKLYPNIKIYCFEPLKINYDNLVLGIKKNNINNIIPLNFAITKDGRDVISVSSINFTGGAMIVEKNDINSFNTDHFIINKVKSITINDIFKKYDIYLCKLLKMDIEGFEHEVIPNISKEFDYIEYLSGEIHFLGGKDLKEICQQYFTDNKLCLKLVHQELNRPTDSKKILELINRVTDGNPFNIEKDIEQLFKTDEEKLIKECKDFWKITNFEQEILNWRFNVEPPKDLIFNIGHPIGSHKGPSIGDILPYTLLPELIKEKYPSAIVTIPKHFGTLFQKNPFVDDFDGPTKRWGSLGTWGNTVQRTCNVWGFNTFKFSPKLYSENIKKQNTIIFSTNSNTGGQISKLKEIENAIEELKTKNYCIQIGFKTDPILQNVNEHVFNLNLEDLINFISKCEIYIGVTNSIYHLSKSLDLKIIGLLPYNILPELVVLPFLTQINDLELEMLSDNEKQRSEIWKKSFKYPHLSHHIGWLYPDSTHLTDHLLGTQRCPEISTENIFLALEDKIYPYNNSIFWNFEKHKKSWIENV